MPLACTALLRGLRGTGCAAAAAAAASAAAAAAASAASAAGSSGNACVLRAACKPCAFCSRPVCCRRAWRLPALPALPPPSPSATAGFTCWMKL